MPLRHYAKAVCVTINKSLASSNRHSVIKPVGVTARMVMAQIRKKALLEVAVVVLSLVECLFLCQWIPAR